VGLFFVFKAKENEIMKGKKKVNEKESGGFAYRPFDGNHPMVSLIVLTFGCCFF